MRLLARPPTAALAPFVATLWHFESERGELPHARERVLPTGSMQLLVNLDEDELRWWDGDELQHAHRVRGAALSGLYERALAIDTRGQRAVCGVSFHAGGAFPFFGASSDALTGEHVPLELLWRHEGATLRERLLEQSSPEARLRVLERVLLARARGGLRRDAMVARAIESLAHGCTIGALCMQLGTAEKTLARCFREQVGLTPKRYARVRRLQNVLSVVVAGPPPSWARLAADHGYSDQAHLVHDFRALTGITPASYRARAPHDRNHVVLAT